MNLGRRFGVVGSREFSNYKQLSSVLDKICERGDTIVSGGAIGADSLAQRYTKERGLRILIIYPDHVHDGRGANFRRNQIIVENADRLYAFYAKGRFQQGGTANTVEWARKLDIPVVELEEE
jgi:predicted Rossmann fold nucleotide-binding protein DprA/Smf involved in DNA uptake